MALFPLGMFLFPGEQAGLHIFEPRYKELLADCEQLGITFGLVYEQESKTTTLGSVVRLKEVRKRYPNGELDIVVECIGSIKVFEIYRKLHGKGYPGGRVQLVDLGLEMQPERETLELWLELLPMVDPKRLPRTRLNTPTLSTILKVVKPGTRAKAQIAARKDVESRDKLVRKAIQYTILMHRQEAAVADGFYLN